MWRENLRAVARDHRTHLAVASCVSFASGVGVSWGYLKKKLETQYSEQTSKEIREAKEFYKSQAKPELIVVETKAPDEEISAEEIAEAIHVLDRYQNGEELVEKIREVDDILDPMPATVAQNIFEHPVSPGEAVLGALFADRSPDRPYVITHDEFYENEGDLVPRELTFYAGDETLADEDDAPVPDIARVVGEDNLLRFGYGSNDENIVFIRNEKLKLVIEVTRSNGKFAHEVLGFETEKKHLEHSDRPRKMRRYDE